MEIGGQRGIVINRTSEACGKTTKGTTSMALETKKRENDTEKIPPELPPAARGRRPELLVVCCCQGNKKDAAYQKSEKYV
jgi:hypothetical protein